MSLAGKVAVVTGASSGIGAAIAVKFSQEGAKVTIVGRNEVKLKNVSQICEKNGQKPLTIVADVSNHDDAQRIISDTIKAFGKLDILINNAGIGPPASILEDNALQVFDKIMATNLRAPVLLTHLAAKYLVEAKGNIVNISSVAGQKVMSASSFSYSTSKAGLDHFTRSIAYELAPKGVRVNVVSPGPVQTDIIENIGVPTNLVDQVWEDMKSLSLLNRIGDAEEIADLVEFIVSEKGRSITGSNIVSDNGAGLKGLTSTEFRYASSDLKFKFE